MIGRACQSSHCDPLRTSSFCSWAFHLYLPLSAACWLPTPLREREESRDQEKMATGVHVRRNIKNIWWQRVTGLACHWRIMETPGCRLSTSMCRKGITAKAVPVLWFTFVPWGQVSPCALTVIQAQVPQLPVLTFISDCTTHIREAG